LLFSSASAVCALHDVDRVDVELAGNPRFGLAPAETEHPDAGNENDGGGSGAEGRGILQFVRLVVFCVIGAIGLHAGLNGGKQRVHVTAFRVPFDEQRANLRADEVIGATRSLIGERRSAFAVDEAQYLVAIGEVTEDAADFAAHCRQDGASEFTAVRPCGDFLSAEKLIALRCDGVQNVLTNSINDAQRLQITLAWCIAPRKDVV